MELRAITEYVRPPLEDLPRSDTAAVATKSDVAPDQRADAAQAVVLSSSQADTAGKSEAQGSIELTPEEKKIVAELKARDTEVRQHERAHMAAAGGSASGGVSYDYIIGPDGQRYATGGEVQIDTAPISGDPEATIRKAQQIRRAALAPAQPSSQDRSVAAAATRMEMDARIELAKQRAEEASQQSNYNQAGIQLMLPAQSQILSQFA